MSRRFGTLAAAVLAAGLLFSPRHLPGFDRPGHGQLPNLDKRRDPARAPKPLPRERAEATEKLKERVRGLKVERDALLQTPRHIVAESGFLTGAKGEGRAVPAHRARALRDDDPHRAIKAFLNEHAAVFGHGAEVVEGRKPRREFVSRHNKLRTVVWEQTVDDIPVYEGVLVGHITAQGELVSLSSQFIPDAQRAADAGTPNRAVLIGMPTVPASQAVLLAAESIEEPLPANAIAPLDAAPQGRERRERFKAGELPGDASVKLTWLPVGPDSLRLCWEVEITRHAGGERYRVLVDGQSGEIQVRQRLTVYLTDASYRVFPGDSPSPFSPGWSAPSTNQPQSVPRTLVTISAMSTNASPIGWISDGENETRGNNVDAHHDWNADDLPDLPRPQGSPFRVFDPPLDFDRFAFDYSEAAIVNLFYWCNWMHDQLYELGFDEASGNYQKDNFGRGGYGNDAIQADAQDGSGINNANFTPSFDGTPGRIQMFLFTGPEPDRDGDFDAEVIIHEYVHGLSTRLVGGGVGISSLQSAGLGEGWSDFYALALLSEPGDDVGAVYPFAGYVAHQFGGNMENYYFGIRRYPYSTNFAKNPLTFKDIDPAQISLHTGVPVNPANPIVPILASEVHASGEVWCSALWEARANLIAKHGFSAGNRLILQLVTDGMKLSPPNPNFLQARDAIILADQVNHAGENYTELWAAFAKRGMGFSARSPDSSTTSGLLEAFDLPDALLIINPQQLFVSGPLAGPFAPECRVYPLTNTSSKPLEWSIRVRQPWLAASPTSGTLTAGAITSVTVCVTTNAAALPLGSYNDTIVFSNTTSKVLQTRRANLRVLGFATMPFTEDFESGRLEPYWSVTGTGSHRTEITTLNGPHAGLRHLTLDAVGGVSSRNEVTLGLDLGGYTNVMLRFWARNLGDEPDGPPAVPFLDEADFDGVAISDDGVRWFEIQGLRFLPPAYTEFVVNLDDAIRAFGLRYSSTFRIRFNQYDNFQIPFDGLGLDDISVTGTAARRMVVGLPEHATEGDGTLMAQGTVTLGAAAPASLVVTLASSNPQKLAVPPSVTVPAGASNVVFNLIVLDNTVLDGTANVTVFAAAPGHFGQNATMAVSDNETAGLRLTLPPHVREGSGTMVKMGLVRANPKPVSDTVVTLRSSDPEKLSVPASVRIEAGSGSASFDLFVADDGNIDGSRNVTVTAHVANWGDGSDTTIVRDNDTPALALVLPVNLGEGNGTVAGAGRVRLSGFFTNAVSVSLSSSDLTELRVPATVEIPAGELEASFDLTVVDDAQNDGRRTATVTARAAGFTTDSGTVGVLDDETPPLPYGPEPAHLSTNVPVSLSLGWKSGLGEIVNNGGFESGGFDAWIVRSSGFGSWAINDGQIDPDGPEGPTNSYAGSYNAVTAQFGAGEHLLYQDVIIPEDSQSATLRWAHKIRNHAAYFSVPNQQFRVEIRDTRDNVIAVPFETLPDDPLLQEWEEHSFDVSAYRGQTIRIAFHQMDNLGYFNVHVDDVSVVLGGPVAPTEFDVYFGNSASLGAANLAGTTTNASWQLPRLTLNTRYFWQIVSRRGDTSTRGPVWQFTTRDVGAVHHFEWGRIASPQQAGQRFAVTITAKDDINNTVKDFTGPVTVTGVSGSPNASRVVVTEIDVAQLDRVEFVNVSTVPVDLSGWQISIYDSVSWPAPLTTVTLPEGSLCPAGDLFSLNEFGTPPGSFPNFISGTNVFWSQVAVGNPIAVLLRDAAGEVVDFVAAGNADPALITAPISIPPGVWSGLPVFPGITNPAQSLQLTGRADRNDATEWIRELNTFGVRNPGLAVPFEGPNQVPVSPAVLTNFVTGVWAGYLTVTSPVPRLTLRAEDGLGHLGVANEISVSAANNLAVSVTATPNLAFVGAEVTYNVIVSNSGPARAEGVTLTNLLPRDVTFLAAETFNGSCRNSGQTVVCELGRLTEGDTARVTIRALTQGFGTLTNVVTTGRAETDSYPGDNTARVVSTVAGPIAYSTNIVVLEGNSGVRSANFPVRLTAACPVPVSVDYATEDLTALAGADYLSTTGTLVFQPGVTNLSVSIPILGDVIDEANEQFIFALSSPTNAVVLGPPPRGRITDDEPQPAISVNDVTLVEGSGGATNYAVFEVSVVGFSDLPLFVNYSTVDETAVSPADYSLTFGTLVFPVGVVRMNVAVPIQGDRRFEADETLMLNLVSPLNATIARGTGVATILDDDAEELDHFEWSPVAPLQFTELPFAASLTAKDGLDRIATGFSGPVQLAGIKERKQIVIGAGTNTWDQPLGTLFHDGRAQSIYLPEEIGSAGRINALALEVDVPPGQPLTNWTIRLKHGSQRNYTAAAWESGGWTTVYRRNETVSSPGWTTFLFDTAFPYNGTDPLLVDFSFDNATYSASGSCRFTTTLERRTAFFQTDSAFGEPSGWAGSSPPPLVTNRLPNIRLSMEQPVSISPAGTVQILGGVWSGQFVVREEGTNVFLRASGSNGQIAETTDFEVLSGADNNRNGLPDSWEARHFGSAGTPESGPVQDPDGDGLNNQAEYRAGTDPTDARSAVRIVGVAFEPASVSIRFESVAGKAYVLERSSNLLSTTWSPVTGTITGTGAIMEMSDGSAAARETAFYRLRLMP